MENRRRRTNDVRRARSPSLGQSFLLTSACRHADRTVSSLRPAAQAWHTVSEDSGMPPSKAFVDAGCVRHEALLKPWHLRPFLLIVCTRRIVTARVGE